MHNYLQSLHLSFPKFNFVTDVVLAPFTQVKLGGPAEVFVETQSIADLTQVVQFCRQHTIPVTILGWGANTLIADRGIKGLVIRNQTKNVDCNSTLPLSIIDYQSKFNRSIFPKARFSQTPDSDTYSDLEYSEHHLPTSTFIVDSGVPLPWLINHTIEHQLTGLQWFARIPATLGGAVVNNIHGGRHFLSELILGVEIVDENGNVQILTSDRLKFGYDTSIFHQQNWVITRVIMQLYQGDVDKARQVVTAWSTQKKSQPQRSLGCVFQNLEPATQRRLHLPTPSVGYYIDRVLGLKGTQLGKASISLDHAAFIISEPGCTSTEYLALIQLCLEQAAKQGVQLKPEIFFKGFTSEELSGIIATTNPVDKKENLL